METTLERATQDQEQLVVLLESLGFVINQTKSSQYLSQKINFLGFLMEMSIRLLEKVASISQEAAWMLRIQSVSANPHDRAPLQF